MTGYSSSSTSEPLHIVCPSAKQPMAIAFAGGAFVFLATGVFRLFTGPAERFSWIKLWLLALMVTACVALLYRNLFVRDELYLYRDEAEDWARMDEDMLVLAAGSVRSLRVCPPPGPYSAESKNASLGMGTGLIEIETSDGCYRFGAGLDADIAGVTAQQIAAYCGLQEIGPQWKAAPDVEAEGP